MPTKPTTDSILPLLKQIVLALEEKKAGDLRVLDVSEKSTITDYLVLATGTSEPHLRALRVELEKVLDAAKVPIAGMDAGTYGSGWTVVDAYQIMMHVFTPEQRENYALEKLWKDAKDVDLPTLLNEPKVKPVRKVARSAPAKKKAVVKKAPAKKVVASKTKKPAAKKKNK
jgi:ribosome-associated protein